MAGKRVLAFDFGASSGRAILASYEDGKISMQEIHRFSNDPVTVCGVFHWDVLRLFFEIKQGITKAVHQGGFDAIGIDTWGVDFGLLDKKGRLLNNPVHYRDERTVGMIEKVFETIPAEELPLLFERFHKSDKSRSEDKDGYGLGLYIVKTILQQHKEEINVTSENGVTTFTFSLRVE